MASAPVPSATIDALRGRMVLNSHLDWTIELSVSLDDGRTGRGASPKGETPSIYEDHGGAAELSEALLAEISAAVIGNALSQEELDAIAVEHQPRWGSAVGYALSVAYYEANRPEHASHRPRILFNLLNGGLHAYTNPIRSDLSEYLLVPRTDDLEWTIQGYVRLLADVRARLADVPTVMVGGNPVHDLGASPTAAALALCAELIAAAGLGDTFGLMVDASAGDWYDGTRYHPAVTDRWLTSEELVDEWLGHLDRFDLAILEDPLAERDLDGWQRLHESRPDGAGIYGDNLTSTLPDEVDAKSHLIDGVLIKPDQNGTVSGTISFAQAARRAGLRLAASHRSIETDTAFLMHLASDLEVDYVKIGPYSDFSSVMRTNALLRAPDR